MLKLNSLFWSHSDIASLSQKFQKLGFNISQSRRYPENQSIFFGPESIELSNDGDEGINKFEFASDDVANDYKLFLSEKVKLEKPKMAHPPGEKTPVWFGFNLPSDLTPFKSWVVMDSPDVLKKKEAEILPLKHPNTVFGYESVTCATPNPQEFAEKWGKALKKPVSKLTWNEIHQAEGARVVAGEKFIDAITVDGMSEGIFMLTFKVVDLELCKDLCIKAGAKILNCKSRDGFIVPGTPNIRFVRSFWRQYLPLTKLNFPFYRREDDFRSLGGVYTSTLEDGFQDNWKY